MAYPDKKALVRRRKAELQEEEKDKKLSFHYYQSTLNDKKELETMEWNKYQSTREEVIKATKKLNEKQKAELKKRGHDV
jgi:UDP-N-acetylglucosamine pyrophosphorylase